MRLKILPLSLTQEVKIGFIKMCHFQTLSKHLEVHYKSKPLDQIYTMVTNAVADKCHKIRENDYKHIPQKTSTLRASLFLTSEPEVRVSTIDVWFINYLAPRSPKKRQKASIFEIAHLNFALEQVSGSKNFKIQCKLKVCMVKLSINISYLGYLVSTCHAPWWPGGPI